MHVLVTRREFSCGQLSRELLKIGSSDDEGNVVWTTSVSVRRVWADTCHRRRIETVKRARRPILGNLVPGGIGAKQGHAAKNLGARRRARYGAPSASLDL